MYYDLHVHTTASDGVLQPREVIDLGISLEIPGLAITDHDTVQGGGEACRYQKMAWPNFLVIPGIELNTDYGDSEVHILGYYIDYNNQDLLTRLQEIKTSRYDRAVKIVDKLRTLGKKISFDRVKEIAHGELIGRPHIAQALMENYYTNSINEAFRDYIGMGKPAYVPRYKFQPAEAIELIKQAGGVSILAHPGLIRDQSGIEDIIKMGVDGLEVFYPEHSFNKIRKYLKIADNHRLLISGGSDFHGIGTENRKQLGQAGVNNEHLQKIIKYVELNHKIIL